MHSVIKKPISYNSIRSSYTIFNNYRKLTSIILVEF